MVISVIYFKLRALGSGEKGKISFAEGKGYDDDEHEFDERRDLNVFLRQTAAGLLQQLPSGSQYATDRISLQRFTDKNKFLTSFM